VARNKRRLSGKEIHDLQKIEKLLDNHSKEVKQNNQPTQQRKVEMKAKITSTESSWIDEIVMSDHGYLRSSERFNMDRSNALPFFRGQLKLSKKIGITKGEDGSESILFANGRIAIYVTLDLKVIKSVAKYQLVTYEPIKTKVAELHAKEIRKLERAERATVRKLEVEELRVNVEIANAKLRMHKTRSESVKMACNAHIKGLEQYIEQLKNEVEEVRVNKRQVCKSMVAVV